MICGDGWSLLEAMVVCRTLGLGYASHAAQTTFFGGRSSKIILSEVHCRGDESNFGACTTASSEMRACHGNSDLLAGVMCSKSEYSLPQITRKKKMANNSAILDSHVLFSDAPDLMIDFEELERSSYVEDRQLYFLQCAMEENCLASSAYQIQRERKHNWLLSKRRLLRFTAKITNVGTADFRPLVPKHMWEFHQCHRYLCNRNKL